MENIKNLYQRVKLSGRAEDLNAYLEAVKFASEMDPICYETYAEYIITSSVGVQTLIPFTERWGMAIPFYNRCRAYLEDALARGEETNKDVSEHLKVQSWMESYYQKYQDCFLMYESMECGPQMKKYEKTYYGSNSNRKQNRYLMSGMIDAFQEQAIPDLIITTHELSPNSMDVLVEYTSLTPHSETFYEWMSTCLQSLGQYEALQESLEPRTLHSTVQNALCRNAKYVRESVLTGDNIPTIYTEHELNSIQEYITFKADRLTAYPESAMQLQQEIYQLYESLDGFLQESGEIESLEEMTADSIVGMLPGSVMKKRIKIIEKDSPMIEATWLLNTRDKKSGELPRYLARNHDLDWGETDAPKKKDSEEEQSSDDSDRMTLDDFKRPDPEAREEPKQEPQEDDDNDEKEEPTKTKGGVNNYYYYTYTHSLNKDSYNQDRSTHDDHSIDSHDRDVTKSSMDSHDRDVNKSHRDDHSTNKRIHSPGTVNAESSIFDLDIFQTGDVFMEGHRFGPDWQKECDAFRTLFDRELDELGDVKNPPTYITIQVGGKKSFRFKSTRGYSVSTGKRIEKYVQLPTAIHQFNVWKDRICDDEIGIGDAIVHYCKTYDSNCGEKNILQCIQDYNIKPQYMVFKPCGNIGLTLTSNLSEDGFGLNITTDLHVDDGELLLALEGVLITEANLPNQLPNTSRPQSDHPVRDRLLDVDRATTKVQQKAKKQVQNAQQTVRAAMKPVNRTKAWVTKMVYDWKDADETKIKERLADPQARKNIFSAVGWAIKTGSIAKAGLLLNPIFLFLTVTKRMGQDKKTQRIRNEMLAELKVNMEILDDKIRDANRPGGDPQAAYKMKRLKNELQKKYMRVADTTKFGSKLGNII